MIEKDNEEVKKDDLFLEYDAFLRSFKRNIDVLHSFLLGAGTSISSGIQSAHDCIWEWKKDIYLSKNINSSEYYKNHKDESIRKSIQIQKTKYGKSQSLANFQISIYIMRFFYPYILIIFQTLLT